MNRFIILALFLSGCSTGVMKRCPDKFEEADVYKCEEVIQGFYRDCEAPKHLYKCTDPQ